MNKLKVEECTRVKCLFYCFKALGIAPVNLVIEQADNPKGLNYTVTLSRRNYLYSALLFYLVVIWNIFTLFVFNLNFIADDAFNVTLFRTIDVVGIISSNCIVVIFCVQNKKQAILFDKLNDARTIIFANAVTSHWRIKSYSRIIRIVLISLLVRLVLFATVGFLGLKIIVLYGGLAVPQLIRNALIVQYAVVLNFLQTVFAIINDDLLDLPNDFNELSKAASNVRKLTDLYESYRRLARICKDLSSFFSLPMILCLFGEFLNVMADIYYLAKVIFIKGSDYLYPSDYIFISFSVLNYALFTILLTNAVRNTVNESKRTREIMFDCLQKSHVQTIKNKIAEFCSYLSQQNINFTIYDYIALDGSLVVSIAGVMTTYLMILLQFQA